ncbi:MAG: hypothetical protein ACI9MF_002332, partial [Gammaproteobacteria bacterium]
EDLIPLIETFLLKDPSSTEAQAIA